MKIWRVDNVIIHTSFYVSWREKEMKLKRSKASLIEENRA